MEKHPKDTAQFKIGDSFFYDDDPYYPSYTETEAEEIIYPIEYSETNEPETLTDEAKSITESEKQKFSLALIAESTADFTEAVGDMTIRLIKGIFTRLSPVLAVPFLLLYTLGSKLFEKVKAVISGDIKKLSKKKIRLFEDIKSINTASKKRDNKTAFFMKNTSRAVWASVTRHESFMKSVFNIALPVIVIALVFSFAKSTRDKVFALELP